MGEITVEQIVSADGYAADADGGLEFFAVTEQADPVDDGQREFLAGVDAICLGAATYRMFADYWPNADPEAEPVATPINALPKYVVSNSLTSAPWGDGEIEVLGGDPVEAVLALRERHRHTLIWGSLTLTDALLEAGAVDRLRLRVVPVLLGEGRSFTPAGLAETRLALESAQTRPLGQVTLQYRLAE